MKCSWSCYYSKSKNFKGVEFKEISFIPKSITGKSANPKYMNTRCSGVEFIIIAVKHFYGTLWDDIPRALLLQYSLNTIHPFFHGVLLM